MTVKTCEQPPTRENAGQGLLQLLAIRPSATGGPEAILAYQWHPGPGPQRQVNDPRSGKSRDEEPTAIP